MGKGKSKVQRPPFPFDAGAFGGQGVPPPRRPQPSCVAAPSLRGVTLVSVCSLCLHFVFSFGFTNLVLIFLFACLFASELHYPVDLIVDEIVSLVGVDSMFFAICFCMNCLCLDCFVFMLFSSFCLSSAGQRRRAAAAAAHLGPRGNYIEYTASTSGARPRPARRRLL